MDGVQDKVIAFPSSRATDANNLTRLISVKSSDLMIQFECVAMHSLVLSPPSHDLMTSY